MVSAVGGEFRLGPNDPPGAGSDRKLTPPSVVVMMIGQSREPQATLPSTHQWVVLTAVNDRGTNAVVPGGAVDAGTTVVDVVDGGTDVVDLEASETDARVGPPQPANNPAPARVAPPMAARAANDPLMVRSFTL